MFRVQVEDPEPEKRQCPHIPTWNISECQFLRVREENFLYMVSHSQDTSNLKAIIKLPQAIV